MLAAGSWRHNPSNYASKEIVALIAAIEREAGGLAPPETLSCNYPVSLAWLHPVGHSGYVYTHKFPC